ncbi:MAG: acyl carrier protein [Vulcanimicrobiota bacterium]
MRIEQRVREYLLRHVPERALTEADLFGSGYLTSLFALQLVMFLEKEFSIQLGPDDLQRANFQSFQALIGLVRAKL